MDVQTLLVGLAIFIISALLIWLITSLTVRERPFEERLAQQRQMEKDLLFLDGRQGAHGFGSKKEKIKKKPGKKTKAPGEQDANGLVPVEKVLTGTKLKNAKLLQLEIDPTVIETALDEPPERVGKNKATKAATIPAVAGKPILANKSEKIAVRKEDHAPELVHHRAVPKDDLELKHDREKFKSSYKLLNKDTNEVKNTSDQSASAKTVPEKVVEKVETVPVVAAGPTEVTKTSSAVNGNSSGAKSKKQKVQLEEIKPEIMVKTQIEQVVTAAPALSTADQSSKKKSKVATTESSTPVSIDGIIASLHRGPLNTDETKYLIEILTTKRITFAENVTFTQELTKKGQRDPVNAVAQQLEEKRREIEEGKLRNAIASQKVNELELELSEQRQKMAALVKQNYELNSQRQENAAMAGHIKQLESAAVTMRNQYESLKTQWTTSHNELQRITTENHHLAAQNKRFNESGTSVDEMRTKVKIMEDALHSNSIQYNACENAKKSFESKVKHLEEQVSFLEKSLRDSQLVAKHYSEAPEELRKAELRIKSLTMELDRLNVAMQHVEKELALKQDETKLGENKLHDISRQKAELEGRLRLADTQTAELVNTLKLRDAEVQALKAQLNDVSSEVKVVRDRPVLSNENNIREETLTKSEAPATSAPPSVDITRLLENGTSVEHEQLQLRELEEYRDKLKAEIEALTQLQDLEKIRDQLTAEIEGLKQDNKVLETSKKECDALNKSLDEKVGELEQERNKVESTLNEKQKELADIQTKLNQKEWEFKELETRLSDKEIELSNTLRHVVENANGSADVSPAVTRKDAAVVDLESRLQQKEIDHSKLLEQLHRLETDHSGLRATLLSKEAELADLQASLHRLEAELLETNERIRQKDAESGGVDVSHVKLQLELKSAELDEHRSRLLVIETNASSLESTLREKDSQLAELNVVVNSITEERSDLQARLLTSQVMVESLQKSQTESSSVKDDVDKYAKQVQCLQSNFDSLQSENSTLKETIQRIQSDLQRATQSADNEKSKWDTEQAALLQKQVALQSELDRTKESENILLMQIQHYKDVLSDTESILKRLQETVELEEQKNLQKLLLLETDLRSTKEEVSRLREDMKGMHRTSECFMGATFPAVDHSECMLRKDLSPVNKRLSLTELTGQSDAV